MEQNSITESFLLGVGAIYGYLTGLNYALLLILLLVMVCDIIVGVLFALINEDFISSVMKRGVIVKFLILILVFTLVFFQIALSQYGLDIPLANISVGIIIFMEVFSIVETLAKENIVPVAIQRWFRDSKEKIDDITIDRG